jgi:hypothetical protein
MQVSEVSEKHRLKKVSIPAALTAATIPANVELAASAASFLDTDSR